jgi:hypothetical protein
MHEVRNKPVGMYVCAFFRLLPSTANKYSVVTVLLNGTEDGLGAAPVLLALFSCCSDGF